MSAGLGAELEKIMGRELKRVAPGSEYGEAMDEDPDYTPGDWYQMWQTVSDKPYTPAFETPEELARWCAENPWGMEKDNSVSYETWLRFIAGPKWAPSMMGIAGHVVSGVEYITTKLTGRTPQAACPVERIVRRQREYQPGAGQHLRHPTYGQLRAMPVERRPSAKRNPPDRQGDRNAFEQP